ncbi:hypothetical protein [Isorropodon fossajaponicum symbiont]|uniref:hypothetical protein n=1 Tax=Isorropodon fossajaponicum symbiont TaxID=883811 RepID=UPI00191652B5|nr:hypothetical protein [Isorropodon fossajaponicum symbiont]
MGNLAFEDKSSREGLQENKTFQILKQKILNILEIDRAIIAKKMKLFYDDVHADDKVKEDADKLAKRIEEKDGENEQKILRGMATSAIVTASFSHELGNLSSVLNSRINNLIEMLEENQPPNLYQDTPDFLNPYVLIEEMRGQDAKLQSWLKFSLTSARKDKRRKKLY